VAVAGQTVAGAVPALRFAVEGAEAVRFAAAPTVAFALRLESDRPLRSVLLAVQLRIAATRRAYAAEEQDRLVELFGEPERWGTTLRSLLWTHETVLVPAFDGSTVVELPVACTYDFEVASAKYLNALAGGEVPLELLFSGSVFFDSPDGSLSTTRISWESEAAYGLPVAVWREALEHHFPGEAWVRVRREVFDRLYAFRAARALPTWDATLEALLEDRT
jgi:hypothetical protein